MSTYEDDHNINTQRRSVPRDSARQHQTLSSAIDNFLTQDTSNNSTQASFERALDLLATEEGSELALQLLNSINQGELQSIGDENGEIGKGHKGGVSDEFLDSLERVPLNKVPNNDTADCPICTNRFVDNEYPLIVRLPCKVQHASGIKAKGHIFDLECVAPWLKMNSTCPLCRFDVVAAEQKRKEKLEEELRKAREEDDEEEEEDWDVYG